MIHKYSYQPVHGLSQPWVAEVKDLHEKLDSTSFTAIEVRLSSKKRTKDRYDVILIDSEGGETVVKFKFHSSKLIYIYTLLHPKGYQRRKLQADNYLALRRLYNLLFFRDDKSLMKSINGSGFDHFVSQFVSQSRTAVRRASNLAEQFVIDHPHSHNGKLLIPFVAQGGRVHFDKSIINLINC